MSVRMALTTVPLAKCVSTHWAPSAAGGKNAAAWAMNCGTTPAKVSLWPSLEWLSLSVNNTKIWFLLQATLLFRSRHQRVRSGHPQLRARLCLQQHPGLFPLRPQRQVPGWLHRRRHRQLHWWAWCRPQGWRFFWLNGGKSTNLSFCLTWCLANDMFFLIRYKRVRHQHQPVLAVPDVRQHNWLLRLQQKHGQLRTRLSPDRRRLALWRWESCQFILLPEASGC